MARYQSASRSDEEWFQIINECRRSGLSDSQWCKLQITLKRNASSATAELLFHF